MLNKDKILLESLISKYGKSNVNLAINRLNENNENPKSGIFIEYHDHLNFDAFRILVLDNGVNVLRNDPLEVEVVSTYTGKQYIAKLEPKYNNDYIEVDFVHSYIGDLCLIKAIKELHAKYSNLPIYCFTEGFYTFKGEYKNVQKFFNDIFSKYLRGMSFEFIPGTLKEFLKSNMNESLNENIINENTKLKTNIQEFFKANDYQFEEFRKDLFKYGFGIVSSFFYTGENEVKLIFESKFIDNYFAHQPNEYKVTVCVGSMKSPDVEILRVQTRNGLTKQLLYDSIEKFLIEEFGEMNESSKTNIVNEIGYEYDYNRLNDCPLTYNTQLDFKKYFIKRSTQEGYKFNKNVFYFDDIDCVDTKTSRDIPGVKANKTLNFDEAYNRLLKYFLNSLQEHVNESDDSSMYDAFGERIYPSDYVIVVAHNDEYPEGKMLKGTFVKLAANSRLVGVVETEEYDQKTYKFPKYIKEPQTCIAKYK